MDIISSGIVAISDGVSSTGLYVIQEGKLRVLSNGWAEEIRLALAQHVGSSRTEPARTRLFPQEERDGYNC